MKEHAQAHQKAPKNGLHIQPRARSHGSYTVQVDVGEQVDKTAVEIGKGIYEANSQRQSQNK